MASVYNSPHNESHIRHLLQQRTAPSNIHSHFQSLADFPDSPSVYSRSQFTPRPSESSQRFDEVVAPRTHRDQLQPDTVDFGRDPRSSYASSSVYDRTSYVGDYCTEEDDEPENRMSMLGIKMRFHSKAPWEMGEDDIVEEDEPDSASVYRPPSRSKRSLKSFGGLPRPSGDSSRSGSVGKKSFETTSSQLSSRGALQALAQASMSTSSLASTPPPGRGALRQKLSLPRLRTRTISNSTNSAASPFPHTGQSPRSPAFSGFQASPTSQNRPASPAESECPPVSDTHSVFCRSPSPSGHPYANPELVRSYTEMSGNRGFDSQGEEDTSDESLATLTSSIPTTGSIHKRALSTAPSSPVSIHDRARIQGISAPIPLAASALQPRNSNAADNKWRQTKIFPSSPGSGIVGWQEPQPSAFTLISLEEARAQRNLTIDSVPSAHDHAALTRPRFRSTSTGGKTRNAGESSRLNISAGKSEPTTPESASQGKSLKHKKSGFMRMFAKEKERTPMPSLPVPTSFPDTIPPIPRTPKVSTHRVPVPPLSPTKYDSEHGGSADSTDSHEEGTVGEHEQTTAPSAKRLMPSLSINTSGSAKRLLGGASSPSHLDLRPPAAPFALSQTDRDHHPRSAPPGTTDFVGLKLRPVSTMFSSHFADHILDPDSAVSERSSQPSLQMGTDTPTTATYSESISPISLDFSSRAIHHSRSEKFSVASSNETEADIVRALQDQVFSAKQAWQRHIWELEGQVRDLKAEIEEMKHSENGGEYCGACGRGHRRSARDDGKAIVSQRPRAHTGRSSRFVDS